MLCIKPIQPDCVAVTPTPRTADICASDTTQQCLCVVRICRVGAGHLKWRKRARIYTRRLNGKSMVRGDPWVHRRSIPDRSRLVCTQVVVVLYRKSVVWKANTGLNRPCSYWNDRTARLERVMGVERVCGRQVPPSGWDQALCM